MVRVMTFTGRHLAGFPAVRVHSLPDVAVSSQRALRSLRVDAYDAALRRAGHFIYHITTLRPPAALP